MNKFSKFIVKATADERMDKTDKRAGDQISSYMLGDVKKRKDLVTRKAKQDNKE